MYQIRKRKFTIIIFLFIIGFLNGHTQTTQYNIKNLNINTKYSDFGASFYGNNHIIFSSPRNEKSLIKTVWKPNKQRYLDLYIGSIDANGEITNKQQLLGEINSKYHQAQVVFTIDLSTIYFTGNDPKNTVNLQLFKATIAADGKWVNIEKLPFNGDQYSTGHPALSSDNKQLYFISDRPGTFGKTDIYVVDIYEDGTYSEPKNLGPTINTAHNEMFPFISEDNTLYFSSKGHTSIGGLDVFASKIVESDFSEPLNLGKPVNSIKDDFSFIIDSNRMRGYFSSNRKKGKGDDDIYSVELLKPTRMEYSHLANGLF